MTTTTLTIQFKIVKRRLVLRHGFGNGVRRTKYIYHLLKISFSNLCKWRILFCSLIKLVHVLIEVTLTNDHKLHNVNTSLFRCCLIIIPWQFRSRPGYMLHLLTRRNKCGLWEWMKWMPLSFLQSSIGLKNKRKHRNKLFNIAHLLFILWKWQRISSAVFVTCDVNFKLKSKPQPHAQKVDTVNSAELSYGPNGFHCSNFTFK